MDNVDRAIASEDMDWDGQISEMLPRIYRYFWYRVGDERSAEDLTGETFERAWRDRKRFRPNRGTWPDWVFGIARHVASDYYRCHKNTKLPLNEGAGAEERPTEVASEQRADLARLGLLISRLAERDRDLMALKYGAGLTNRAIAALTGLSESNVGTILHRAVSAIRREWENQL